MRWLILFTLLLSCQKEIMPECLIQQTGTIRFDNQSGKAYFISVDGVTATIGGDFNVSGISAGVKQVKVIEQPDGQLRIIEVEVLACDTSIVELR